MEQLAEDVPRMAEFYAGRSILVTGFSGFIGKALVEKILRSCGQVRRIYLLLRAKKGHRLQQRYDNIINSDVFARVRESDKDLLNKLIPIEGDATLPGLGISPEVRRVLCEEVSIIFHCAASVRFDDPLSTALDINLKGTESMVGLALQMTKLTAYVHVSTAYSNCNRFEIEEKIYPPMADWKNTLKIRDKVDPETLSTLQSKYTNHMPNTYVFSKALAEQLVNDHADRLPIVVFRPSIVVNAHKEPFPGYVENFNGPIGVMLGCSLGVMRTFLTNPSCLLDFIPIDVASRGLLFSAYIRAHTKNEGAQVYNYCASERSVKIHEITVMGRKLTIDAPMKFFLWRPAFALTDSKVVFYINFILFQMIPAFLADIAIRISGREPLLMKIQRRIYTASVVLSHFTLNHFHIHNKKTLSYADAIRREDEHEFYVNIKEEDFDHYGYFLTGTKYVQKKFFKMDPKDTDKAKLLMSTMIWVDRAVKTSFWTCFAYLVYEYQVIQTIVYGTIDFLLKF